MKTHLSLSQVAFQAAFHLAQAEGKPVGLVIEPFLVYATPHASEEAYLIYRVQTGDTLGTVARQFYGDGRKHPLLKKANNLADSGEIWAGLVLVIPPLAVEAAPAQETEQETLLSQALARSPEKSRVEALVALLPRLTAAQLKETWAAAYEVEDIWEQSKLMAALAPHLAELGDLAAALMVAREVKRSWSQARALAQIAPHLFDRWQDQALDIARAITRPEDRATALIGLLPYLPEPSRTEVIAETTATVALIEGKPLQAEAQVELAACLDRLGYWLEAEPAPVKPEPDPTPEPDSFQPADFNKNTLMPGGLPPLNPTPENLAHRLPGLLRQIKPIWAVPLLILGLCVAMLFTASIAVGSILLAGQDPSLERIEIPSNGHSTTSRASLKSGEFYSIVVSGRFNYNIDQPESWADAQSSYYQRTGDWVAAYWISIDGQKVIAQQADPAKHQYMFYVQGSDRPVQFRIEERREEEYANNRGALQIAIYSGLLSLEDIPK